MESPDRIDAGPVTLRRFTMDDAREVQSMVGEWEVARNLVDLVPHPYPDGAAEAWIGGHAQSRAAGGDHTYAVTRASDALLVGTVGIRPNGGHEHFGYWVGRSHWGQGYATAAAGAAIALLFARTDLEAIWSTYLADNHGSGRVMEKNGMIELRREVRTHRGEPRPFIVRGITRAAWDARLAAAPPGR